MNTMISNYKNYNDRVELCTCVQCGSVFYNLNAGKDSIKFHFGLIELFTLQEVPIIKEDKNGFVYGCDNCKTDSYLQDNIINAGGVSSNLNRFLSSPENIILNFDMEIWEAIDNTCEIIHTELSYESIELWASENDYEIVKTITTDDENM